jgi:hypothetical protein
MLHVPNPSADFIKVKELLTKESIFMDEII